jgi:hypothetical protein
MSDTRLSTRSSPLPELIRCALHADASLWYPGLAPRLIEDFEQQQTANGWCRDNYGTYRWIVGDAGGPIIQLGVVRVGAYESIVEAIPQAAQDMVAGVPRQTGSLTVDVSERLQAAINRISGLDRLAESLGCLVRSCHIIEAERGYDVSHSTPALPFTIFVSVPRPDERDAELRLAESIIHEAMHLQLTFIESSLPLVRPTQATAFSPWKRSNRPTRGVLHRLYVFAVIYEALAVLAAVDPDARDYAETRRPEIAADAAAIGDARANLTHDGALMGDKLLSRVRDDG